MASGTGALRFTELAPKGDQTTVRVTCQATEEDGSTALPAASLTTLTLTVHDGKGNIVNTRNAIDILNATIGTVDSSGNVVVTLTPDDNTITAGQERERRICLFAWTWSAGAKKGTYEVAYSLVNLQQHGSS